MYDCFSGLAFFIAKRAKICNGENSKWIIPDHQCSFGSRKALSVYQEPRIILQRCKTGEEYCVIATDYTRKRRLYATKLLEAYSWCTSSWQAGIDKLLLLQQEAKAPLVARDARKGTQRGCLEMLLPNPFWRESSLCGQRHHSNGHRTCTSA